MAHHEDKAGSAVADRVGLFTTLVSLGAFVLAIVMIVKHPKIAIPCVIAAAIFAGICPNPTQHPLLGLLAMCVGASLVKGK